MSKAAISALLIFLMSFFFTVDAGERFSSFELYSICFSKG